MSRISEALDQLAIGRDLPEELVVGIMNDLLEGELTPVQVGGLLLGLRVKGESAEEIAAFAKALRAVSRQISAPDGAVDTAPLYHPAMGKVALFRRELGIRTIFNLLGPLLNPASAPYQLLGVSSPGLLPKMAEALKRLDSKRALVVVGDDGLDEVTLTGQTHAILVDQGVLKPFEIFPEDYGFKRCSLDALRGGSSEENARLTQGILQGETGPKRDIVLLNAGIAIYVAKRTNTIQEGIDLARYSLDSGQAFGKLNSLR
ncbi:anthranilate phosphoribosyltransferase, partial [Desulfosporosinus sp. Tol-M]